MKFLIVMDSYKGCMTAYEACNAVMIGILRANPEASIDMCPMSDGGDGMLETLIANLNAQRIVCSVEGPYGERVQANYGILPDATAIMEIAQAAGLHLSQNRDLMHASTYGVGMLIRNAIVHGCHRFVIGLGGSATNDGGAGMLQALGIRLLDNFGKPIGRGPMGLSSLASIDESCILPELRDCIIQVACDVKAPLLGPKGCSTVFGPQKGASVQDVQIMDQILTRYASLVSQNHPKVDPQASGCGAAGGLGFALKAFFNAELVPGLPLIANLVHLQEKIQNADYIITGEGKLDTQSLMGKVPVGIATIAKKYHKSVIAIAGEIGNDIELFHKVGIDAVFSIQNHPSSFEEAMQPETASKNLTNTAEEVARLLKFHTLQN